MTLSILTRPGKPALAYHYTPAGENHEETPLILFLGGYRSDMNGTKATWLEQRAQARGQGYVRFDYSGHGSSEGKFEDGTIGQWKEDAIAILDHISPRRVLLVGSSMGGWIAFLAALARSDLIHGLIGIAAAPDFTDDLYENRLNSTQKEQLEQDGRVLVPNDYSDEPYIFTKHFYEEARENFVLNQKMRLNFPVHLIQGRQDKDVPWQTTDKIKKIFDGSNIDVTFIEDGGHSLSRPEDLELIDQVIKKLCGLSYSLLK